MYSLLPFRPSKLATCIGVVLDEGGLRKHPPLDLRVVTPVQHTIANLGKVKPLELCAPSALGGDGL